MSRIVKAVPFGMTSKVAAANDGTTVPKEYLERIGKYVPGEIIAAYTSLVALLASFPNQIKYISYIICFVLCWILTPLYFKLVSTESDKPSLRKQQVVSFFAFLFWAYAIDGDNGIFGKMVFNIYYQAVGGALLIIFTLVSGLIIPVKKSV